MSTTLTVGDACIMNGIVGRILEHEPGRGFVLFGTPHGSTFMVGFVWIRPLDDVQRRVLHGYERSAMQVGKAPYRAQWSADRLAEMRIKDTES